MSDAPFDCHRARDEFAGYTAQAVDQLLMRIIEETHAAVVAVGERDYLDGEDIEAIYRLVAATMAGHRWQPPRPAAIADACRRLNVPVAL